MEVEEEKAFLQQAVLTSASAGIRGRRSRERLGCWAGEKEEEEAETEQEEGRNIHPPAMYTV